MMDTFSQPLSIFNLSPRRIRYAAMGKTNDNGELLRAARKARKLSQEALGALLDPPVSKQQIYKMEVGRQRISAAVAAQFGKIFDLPVEDLADEAFVVGKEPRGSAIRVQKISGLPVAGFAQAGYWAERDMIEFDPDDAESAPDTIAVIADKRFPASRQYALQLIGSSLNRIAPDGSFVICVSLDAYPGGHDEARLNGKLVHVERRRRDLVETTVKRFVLKNGEAELWPDSDDPKHQSPVPYDKGTEEVAIIGVVIGRYSREE